MAVREMQGQRKACETVGQLLDALSGIDPETRCGGGLDDMLEVALFKDRDTGELFLEIEEEM